MPKYGMPAKISEVGDAVEFVENVLKKYGINRKEILGTLLVFEEILVRVIENSAEDANVQLKIKRRYNTALISVSARGNEFDNDNLTVDINSSGMEQDAEDSIRSLLLSAHAEKYDYSRRGNYNIVKIKVGTSEQVFLYRSIIALVASLIFSALCLVVLGENLREQLLQYVMTPVMTFFLNALNLVTAPAIFFSIMVCVARYAYFTDPGRINGKVIVNYVATSIAAVLVGFAVCFAFEHLIPQGFILKELTDMEYTVTGGAKSIYQMITEAVPDNIIVPFLETNSLQLVLIATVAGVALGKAGQYSEMLCDMANALNKFFSVTVEIVSATIPYAIFFIMTIMILSFGFESLLTTLIILGLVIVGFLVMFVGYLLYIWICGGLNPIVFVKKYAPYMMKTFLKGSSINSIADNKACCEKEFGVSPKLTSFSIPFGAIANLDGNCIYLTIAGLLLARICGVDMLGNNVIATMFIVIILSVGAPITPGSTVLALLLLLRQFGTPYVVISLVLAVNAFLEMLLAVSNTVGDVAVTLVIAGREKLIDLDTYNKM